jgi:glycolate oxidase FAD binding subunit
MASIPSDQVATSLPEIDGLSPSQLVSPSSPHEVADILASAAIHGQAVAPIGGCTKLALGNVPERFDIALSTANLRGIIGYEPTDLTLSVWAGSRFEHINAELAKHGQTLPIDVPEKDATIGGLIATGLAGPRRGGSPTLRDLLIGISAAHPSGTVTKAGGMVVKNVTGFDLMRLYLGSLGTLGVIVSANFKVIPLARYEQTIVATFPDLSKALAAGSAVRESRVRPIALELFRKSDDWGVTARIAGREATVRLLVDEAKDLMAGDQHVFDENDSKDWWQNFAVQESPTTSGGDVVLRCAIRPRQGGDLLVKTSVELESRVVSTAHLSLAPALGVVTTRFTPKGGRLEFLEIRNALLDAADNVTVLAAPAAWKDGIDVWGKRPETLDVMMALKEQFDPARVLNPGRFADRI